MTGAINTDQTETKEKKHPLKELIAEKKLDGSLLYELITKTPLAALACFLVWWLTQTMQQSIERIDNAVTTMSTKIDSLGHKIDGVSIEISRSDRRGGN